MDDTICVFIVIAVVRWVVYNYGQCYGVRMYVGEWRVVMIE